MHFVKTATDCWTAVVASSGFFVVAAATAIEMEKKKRRKRQIWTKPWIPQRPVAGTYNVLIMDLFATDEISYRNFMRMDAGAAEELFSRIEANLTKQATRMRKPIITAKEHKCASCCGLATGKNQCLPKRTVRRMQAACPS